MRRKMMDTLFMWKKEPRKCPLVLRGTRQSGKTWLLKEFGQRYFSRVAYFHLETDAVLRKYFEEEQEPAHLLEFLEVHGGVPIHGGETLVILDEIQASPGARAALGGFSAEFPGYSIVAAERTPGKGNLPEYAPADARVETLYPMDFEEFLWACREVALAKEIREHFFLKEPLKKDAHRQALHLFRVYLITGGMPSAVREYRESHSLLGIGDVHSKLVQMDLADIYACSAKENRAGIRATYRSLPAQLKKENPCFQYRLAQKGGTKKQLEEGLLWIEKHQLAWRLNENSGNTPTRFRLYPRDVGLCATGMNILPASLLQFERTPAIQHLVEVYLAMAFARNEYHLSYWTSGNKAELPFLLEKENRIIAIDLHFWENRKSRSLFEYQRVWPNHKAYRISEENFKSLEKAEQIPYYATFCI